MVVVVARLPLIEVRALKRGAAARIRRRRRRTIRFQKIVPGSHVPEERRNRVAVIRIRQHLRHIDELVPGKRVEEIAEDLFPRRVFKVGRRIHTDRLASLKVALHSDGTDPAFTEVVALDGVLGIPEWKYSGAGFGSPARDGTDVVHTKNASTETLENPAFRKELMRYRISGIVALQKSHPIIPALLS